MGDDYCMYCAEYRDSSGGCGCNRLVTELEEENAELIAEVKMLRNQLNDKTILDNRGIAGSFRGNN